MKELKKVILIGPMGAGKSTLGKEAARVLGWQYFDNDAEMSLRYGFTQDQLGSMSVPELHQLESRYLADGSTYFQEAARHCAIFLGR